MPRIVRWAAVANSRWQLAFEARQGDAWQQAQAQTNYSVQAEHPEFGFAIDESYATMNAAVARAAELIKEGYTVEIFSASAVASR